MRPVWWNRQEDQHRSSRSVALFRNDAPLHFDVGSPLKRGAKAPFIFVSMCSLHNCTSTADSTGVVCIRCVNYCPMDGLCLSFMMSVILHTHLLHFFFGFLVVNMFCYTDIGDFLPIQSLLPSNCSPLPLSGIWSSRTSSPWRRRTK